MKNMTWRKLLLVLFALEIFLAALVILIVFRPLPTESREFLGLRSTFPAGPYQRSRDGVWIGYSFRGELRLLSMEFAEPRAALESLAARVFSDEHWIQEIDLADGGLAAVQRRGRSYVLYALFRSGNEIFWLTLPSANSLTPARNLFEKILLKMEISGPAAGPALPGQLEALWRQTPPVLMVDAPLALAFLLLLLLLGFLPVYYWMYRGGRCPSIAGFDFCWPGLTLIARKKGGRLMVSCCLVKENRTLIVFRSGREILRIDLDGERNELELRERSLVRGGVSLLLSREQAARVASFLW